MTAMFVFSSLALFAQRKIQPVEELLNGGEEGWTVVEDLLKSAKNKVEILDANVDRAKESLYRTQVTTKSPMGAIVYKTGGVVVDDGWIRILGSGSDRLNRTLPEWNKGKSFREFGETPSFLLIADDVIGGFFLLNGGALGDDLGKIYYFSPDNLEFEPLDLTYTGFLQFCFNSNLDEFYSGYRWKTWRADISRLDSDTVFTFYPYLWSKEGKEINKISKKPISAEEQFRFNKEMREQLNFDE